MKSLLAELSNLKYGCDVFEIFKVAPLSDRQIAEQAKKLPVFED